MDWLRKHKPDVVIFVHLYNVLGELQQVLERNGIRAPQDEALVPAPDAADGQSAR